MDPDKRIVYVGIVPAREWVRLLKRHWWGLVALSILIRVVGFIVALVTSR